MLDILEYFHIKLSYVTAYFKDNLIFRGQKYFYHCKKCLPYYDKVSIIKLVFGS